jgi:hypothetical protein
MTPMIAWAEQWWHLAYCCPGAPIDHSRRGADKLQVILLVDRPGAEIGKEPLRSLAKFRRRRIQAEIGAGFELGTIRVPLHLRMSPAGIAECRGWQRRQRCDDRHTDEVSSMHGIPPYVAQTVSYSHHAAYSLADSSLGCRNLLVQVNLSERPNRF